MSGHAPFAADSPHVDEVRPAFHFGARRGDGGIDILMLHYTGMDSADGALDWLCCEESGVSCHYFVFEDGRTVQLLPERARAHHAGAGSWHGDTDVNSRSIGIEIANGGHPAGLPPFPAVQMEAVARLSRDVIERHGIAPERVLAHSDTAPARKVDPGERFDWCWLAGQGVGRTVSDPPEPGGGRFLQEGDRGEPVAALQSMLALFGYGVPVDGTYDETTRLSVAAFQRHHRRSLVDGVADASTIETLHRLLAMDARGTADTVPAMMVTER